MISTFNLKPEHVKTAPERPFFFVFIMTKRYSQLCFVSHWPVLCSTWTYDLQTAKHSFTCKNAVV